MTTTETAPGLDDAAKQRGLEIRPEWRANVAQFVEVAHAMAKLVEDAGGTNAQEAAPVFTPTSIVAPKDVA